MSIESQVYFIQDQTMETNYLTAARYPPVNTLSEIEAIERVPLHERIGTWDFAARLMQGCERSKDRPALHFIANGDSAATALTWTYGDLRERSLRVANLLSSCGLGAQDPVLILTPALPGLYAAVIGAFLAARPFPANWMLDAKALEDLIRASGARAVIALGPTTGFDVWERVGQACAALERPLKIFSLALPGAPSLTEDLLVQAAEHPGDALVFERANAAHREVAAFVHSGGTTGTPKIVRITHGGLVYRQWASNIGLALTCDDVVLADTPMFHIGGFCVRGLVPVANGMTIVVPSMLGARDKNYIANYWKFVERFGITQLSGVPTTLSVLVRHPPRGEDISSLRPYFATGSTGIAPAVQREIAQISGARALMMYGLTENTSNVTIDPRDGEVRPGCSGLRVPYTHIRVVEMTAEGEILRDCSTGEVGMLLVEGPGVAAGYVNKEQDQGAFIGDATFLTGDLGCVDAEGYVRIVGRRKDLIIRGGHNIDPSMIEHALQQAPGVALAAAVGKPDAHAGEIPIAYVQLNEGASVDTAQLIAFAAAHISDRAAVPKEVIVIDAIPLSPVGKPLKHLLQADAASRAFREALDHVAGRWDIHVKTPTAGGMVLEVILLEVPPGTAAAVEAVLSRFAVTYTIRESVETCA